MFDLFPLLKLGDEIRISMNLLRALLNLLFSCADGELGMASTMLTPSELPKRCYNTSGASLSMLAFSKIFILVSRFYLILEFAKVLPSYYYLLSTERSLGLV